MSVAKFELFLESLKDTNRRIDFYCIEDINITHLREVYNLIKINSYRAIATLSESIEKFEEFPATKIALLNYPVQRNTHHRFVSELEKVLNTNVPDEIEFPWQENYMSWGADKWRDIIIKCAKNGAILRPMLEIGMDSDEYIIKSIDFFKKIGITNVMTSTGLIEQVTTIERWNEVKSMFPPIFDVKICANIKDINTAKEFLDSGAKLIATSVDILNSDLIVK